MFTDRNTSRRRFLLGGVTALGATRIGDRRFGSGGRPTTVRACSFNVRYDNPEDEYSWDERLPRVVETVEEIAPGLLGVQEAQPNQYDDLRAALDDYEWYGVGRDDGDREGEMVPVAWRADRYRVRETGEFWLSETPDEPSVGWDADLPRVTTWASLSHRETGRRLWLCNTHFSHVGETARVESAKLVRERADERAMAGEDVVVTGDCNSKPSERPYQILTGTAGSPASPLFDPRREADTDTVSGPWGTYHGFTPEIEDRIDYVFTADTAAVDWYRTLDVRPGEYRSDHLPVVTEVEFGSRRRLPWR
ncbi:endonuclease/exonuclease/phosphatase family protein [Halomarina halobia]|uniref:Endonuclease/exonuclease/phosphatase family protein n=1 Tax=Halomarina halobia TaxID=3033386 RepID=A0ABD6A552_9EURY|nr:endonuclease/exonuclease/phosphatase family protein [Halomarina sp. PSR21]